MGDHECTKEVAETTKDKCALFADSHFQQERTNNAKLMNDGISFSHQSFLSEIAVGRLVIQEN